MKIIYSSGETFSTNCDNAHHLTVNDVRELAEVFAPPSAKSYRIEINDCKSSIIPVKQ